MALVCLHDRDSASIRTPPRAGLAQLVEQRFCKPKVAGSIPATGTMALPMAETNKLGHRIGTRGGKTRQAILDAMRGLLEQRYYGEIRVADVAAAASVSPSNFYTYFKTV